MDFEQIIFKKKTFSSLLEDIYKTSRFRQDQVQELIVNLKDMIKSPGDAVMMIPLLKEYLDIAVKNDDSLIKLASIVQKAMSTTSVDGESLPEKEAQELYDQIKLIGVKGQS